MYKRALTGSEEYITQIVFSKKQGTPSRVVGCSLFRYQAVVFGVDFALFFLTAMTMGMGSKTTRMPAAMIQGEMPAGTSIKAMH